MIICWDLDGTLLKDKGVDYDTYCEFTPLMKLLRNQARPEDIDICVTGRTVLPPLLEGYFDEIYLRDWEPSTWEHYYSEYFVWKCETIYSLKPDLVFEDDQQICRWLTKHGVSCVWVPEYAYMHD